MDEYTVSDEINGRIYVGTMLRTSLYTAKIMTQILGKISDKQEVIAHVNALVEDTSIAINELVLNAPKEVLEDNGKVVIIDTSTKYANLWVEIWKRHILTTDNIPPTMRLTYLIQSTIMNIADVVANILDANQANSPYCKLLMKWNELLDLFIGKGVKVPRHPCTRIAYDRFHLKIKGLPVGYTPEPIWEIIKQ